MKEITLILKISNRTFKRARELKVDLKEFAKAGIDFHTNMTYLWTKLLESKKDE